MSSYLNPLRNKLGRRRFLAGTGALTASAAFLAACGGNQNSGTTALGTPPSGSSEPAAAGGKINLSGADPVNLDFTTQTTPVYWTLHSNRLLKYKTGADVSPNQYDLVGDLATGWETSPDGLKLTFKLNPAAKFHDKPPVNGRAFSSEDVKQAIGYLNTAKSDNLFRYLVDYIDRVDASDANTVSLVLKKPTPLATSYLAYYNAAIPPYEILARDKNLQKDDIGTGPYIFSGQEKSVAYKFTRNPNYFGKNGPYLDEITFNVLADANTALDAFRTGNIDALDIPFDQLSSAQQTISKETATLQTVPGIGWFAYWFNVQRPLFKDLRVRQAFHYAIDRQVINNIAGRGQGAVRTGPVSRGWTQWSRSDAEVNADAKRDVQKAKDLLSAAGYKDGLKVDFMAINSHITGANGNQVQVTQQHLKDAGIDMKINPVDRTAALAKLSTQDFDLGNWSIRAYPDPDDYLSPFFLPGGSKNFGATDDPKLSELITRQQQEADPNKRKAVLQEIDKRWQSEFAYALWTIELPFTHAFQNRLRNYSGRNPSDYANYEGASLKKA